MEELIAEIRSGQIRAKDPEALINALEELAEFPRCQLAIIEQIRTYSNLIISGSSSSEKTQIAKIIERIWMSMGLIETPIKIINRADLISKYINAPRVNIPKTMLIEDEAYSLDTKEDYSKDALDKLNKAFERYK